MWIFHNLFASGYLVISRIFAIKTNAGSSHCSSVETNLTRIHDTGSIPDLTVVYGSGVALSCGAGHRCGLDPVLLWLWHRFPSLGTSICCRCGPKKTKKKKKKKNNAVRYPHLLVHFMLVGSWTTWEFSKPLSRSQTCARVSIEYIPKSGMAL